MYCVWTSGKLYIESFCRTVLTVGLARLAARLIKCVGNPQTNKISRWDGTICTNNNIKGLDLRRVGDIETDWKEILKWFKKTNSQPATARFNCLITFFLWHHTLKKEVCFCFLTKSHLSLCHERERDESGQIVFNYKVVLLYGIFITPWPHYHTLNLIKAFTWNWIDFKSILFCTVWPSRSRLFRRQQWNWHVIRNCGSS